MIIILIVGLIITGILFSFGWYYKKNDDLRFVANRKITLGFLLLFYALLFASYFYSVENYPKEYIKIQVGTTEENGIVDVYDKEVYKKGDRYYTQKLGKALWIPFGECDYVEIDINDEIAQEH